MSGLRRSAHIGILGGTFDPPHCGHLKLAGQALSELRLDRVLLMPVHTPPHKRSERGCASPEDRLQMCRLAVDGLEEICVSDIEVARGGPSYTVDTLNEITDEHRDLRLTLILGADMARTLGSWREPVRLCALADLAVAMREGVSAEEVTAQLRSLSVEERRLKFLRLPPVAVSSSMVRERVRAGESIAGLVGRAVAGYIAEHHLYDHA